MTVERSQLETPDWFYFKVELRVDGETVEVDYLSWKAFISSCLKKTHGLVGECTHFDVLDTPTSTTAIIRCFGADKAVIQTSLLSNTFSLQSLGASSNGAFQIVSKSAYLIGIVGPDRMKWCESL